QVGAGERAAGPGLDHPVGVQILEDLEVALHQLGAGQGAEVEGAVVARVDAVGADGDDDVAVAGQVVRQVPVTLVAGDGEPVGAVGRPVQEDVARGGVVKGHVPAVQEHDHRQRPAEGVEVGRGGDLGGQLDAGGEGRVRGPERQVAEGEALARGGV